MQSGMRKKKKKRKDKRILKMRRATSHYWAQGSDSHGGKVHIAVNCKAVAVSTAL